LRVSGFGRSGCPQARRDKCSALRNVSVDACGWKWAMGVDRLPSDSYRARLMVDGKTYSATFTTEPEAAEWLAVTRSRLVGARRARRVAVEQHARRWLGEFVDAAADIDHYRRDVVEHVLPALGERPLVEVTPAEIAALLEQLGAAARADVADQV
jgi:hypothetical protein